MNIKVRLGTKDDINALVEVECSDVETWYHFSYEGVRGAPASYDALSSWERGRHGGPWMDYTSLTRYWDDMERLGIIPLVAVIDGKVVGHLDIIFSDELPLGYFLYLDVLMVHKTYRRRGVATTLIKEAERLARSRKVNFMLVSPQEYEGPSGLTYRSCGFEKAFDAYHMETPITDAEIPSGVHLVSIPQIQKAPIKTHAMMCGWSNISVKAWHYGINPNIEELQEELHAFPCHQLALSALTNRSTYFFHLGQDTFNHLTGTLYLWAPKPLNEKELRDVFQAAKTVASWLGIKTLTTVAIERYISILEKFGFIIKSKGEPFLVKNINQWNSKTEKEGFAENVSMSLS